MSELLTATIHHHQQDRNINADSQRRPTRISLPNFNNIISSKEAPSNNRNTFNNKIYQENQSSNSRLKCSTIAKVPPAKSRLKQPMAVVSSSSMAAAAVAATPAPDHQKSRLAKPSASALIPKVRPASLALRSHVGMNGNNRSQQHEASASSTKTSSLGLIKSHLVSSKRKLAKNMVDGHAQPARGLGAAKSPPQLSVAVVHPQNSSSRVNLTAATTTTTTTVGKISPTTNTSRQQHHAATNSSQIISGKAGLNHKNNSPGYCDLIGKEERRESKQDGGRFGCAFQPKTTVPSTIHNSSQIDSAAKLNYSPSTTDSPTAATISSGKNERDKNDQFVLNKIITNNHSLSVASECENDLSDKKQHENNKQSTKHLPGHNHSTGIETGPAQAAPSSPSTLQFNGQNENRATNNDSTNNNNDNYNRNENDNAESNSTTKCSSINQQKLNSDRYSHQMLNDRILRKPMGQQVLSLMMLDVGLMPANNNQELQQHSPTKRNYVSLQSPFKLEVDSNDCDSQNPHHHFINADGHRASASTCEHNYCGDVVNCTNVIDNRFLKQQCNEFYSLQPTTNAPQVMRNFGNRHDNDRSVSLPSSPRMIRIRARSEDRHEARALVKTGERDFIRYQHNLTARTLIDDIRRKRVIEDQHRSNIPGHDLMNQPSLLICDDRDNISIASSSCSSLNHCPPLLALSNQLELELVKSRADLNTKLNQKTQEEGRINASRNPLEQPVGQSLVYNESLGESSPNPPRSNDARTHVELLEGKGIRNDGGDQICGEICESKSIMDDGMGQNSDESFGKQDGCPTLQLRLQMEPQDRRQQHPQLRSHSISGQEFQSDALNHRLKQFNNERQNYHLNDYVDSHHQNHYQHHLQHQQYNRSQLTTSYQQQHQQQNLNRRSPSPSVMSLNQNLQHRDSQQNRFAAFAERPIKNQLHASLECINSSYADYQNHQQRQHHQALQQMQPQQHQLHQQHYAASYVTAPQGTTTTINQNGQDLAAATMNVPPAPASTPIPSNMSQHQQNIFNRVMTQVVSSPLRRISTLNHQHPNGQVQLHQPPPTTLSGGPTLLNYLSSQHYHPIRAGHSSLSLASSSFILEDKLQNEIRKIHAELRSEKEKNEALNSQLNINSSLMAAFEQSLTTLNTRLRQLTTLNDKKDNEIQLLQEQINSMRLLSPNDRPSTVNNSSSSPNTTSDSVISTYDRSPTTSITTNDNSENNQDNNSEQQQSRHLLKVIDDLKRQLIEKDRLLTDTRLEALSAAHQLEQLESKLNGDNSLLNVDDDDLLDEGVMVTTTTNLSSSDSDAANANDLAHFNGKLNNQVNMRQATDVNKSRSSNDNNQSAITVGANHSSSASGSSPESNGATNSDAQRSNNSSEYQVEVGRDADLAHTNYDSNNSQQFDAETNVINQLDKLLLTS